MITSYDIVDEIISDLEPHIIPFEFITEAHITDFNGDERTIKGAALKEFLKAPFEVAMEAKILLNVSKLRRAIIKEINDVYDEVNRLISIDFPDDEN